MCAEEGGESYELLAGGRDIEVTSHNVYDYVRRYAEYRMIRCQEKALQVCQIFKQKTCGGIVSPIKMLSSLSPYQIYMHLGRSPYIYSGLKKMWSLMLMDALART